ncbi:hypothetical protein ONZ45_g15588 [Pleurotus djamor]|nr:hypothetical protein ONZ45_g15588 [Pleurotus djamor]
MSSAATDSPLRGLCDDAPQAPTPRHEEPNEETKRKVERFFMFHDFEKDPLFNCVHGTEGGRNLVLCIDGTANQFSAQSSNIVEIYSRLIKLAGVQHTFYNSGIGTYAKPSFRSWKYFKQVADHTIDTAIAWNFERIVHAAYKWLSETYEPGDRIFMFGFSRGAYQVRVVAGMIEKVGLLHKGSDNQIPFAYELYASVTSNSKRKRNPKEVDARTFETPEDILCRQFKRTLCHKDVKVHFVGAWDTVSSIGLLRGKSLPETVSGMGHVCSFRHALALDECRVKFQPEYANGGLGPREGDASCDVKEVWFAGTHSDVGGGSIANPELTNFGPSLRWMIQEATKRGLRLEPTAKHWVPLPLTKSLKWFWLPLEALPIRSLSYKNEDGSTWRPHLCAGRRVQPGQRIHHTVFTRHQTPDRPYCPKATLPEGHTDWPSFFKKHNTLKDDPVIEYDPFEDAATSLLSLEDACRVLSEGDESIITPETMTQYSHSLLALRSFLEAHTSRQTSISDLINVGNILLSALDVSLRPQNATTRINTPDLKEALIQLLAGVKLTAKGDVAYGSKAADIRRWVGPITTKHNRALAIVLNHFACINQQQSDRYIQNVAFSQLDPTKIIFTTRPSTTTSTLLWDGSTQPPKDIAHVQGEYSTISRDGSHIVVAHMRDISIINTTTQPEGIITLSLPDYTGSLGFGEKYVTALLGKCGSLDVEDCIASVNHLVKSGVATIGEGKQFISGGSHGGFLTGHLIGQYPDVFTAAALRNPVISVGELSTSDIPDWYYSEFGLPYTPKSLITPEVYETLFKASPTAYVDEVKAKVLLLIGGSDLRVAPTQGVGYYHALKGRGKKVKMLWFEGEGHPLEGVEATRVGYEVVLDWFKST